MPNFKTSLRSLSAVALASIAVFAQAPDDKPRPAGKQPGPPPSTPVIDFSRVSYDVPREGSLWAMGRTYKIGFEAGAVTYIPWFGGSAPRNYPVVFRLVSVSRDGGAVAVSSAPVVSRNGDRVTIDHGALTECYDLAPETVEQLFCFDRLEGSGDLVVRLGLETDLEAREDTGALRFDGPYGTVRYSSAVIVDAAGARTPVETRKMDGGLEIRVPAGVVAGARLPLTIDPVITAVPVNTSSEQSILPDTAFDSSTGLYNVVWERPFSASDHDVYSQLVDFNGAAVPGSGLWIDNSPAYWSLPRVASIKSVPRYLTVAQAGVPGVGALVIVGRTRDSITSALGPQFQISGNEQGNKINPDVGGDPLSAGPTYFCVVWERVFSAGDHDVHARLVTAGSNLIGPTFIPLADTGDDDQYPAISNSDGEGPISSQRWTVVWQRDFGPDNDIYGAQLAWDGTVTAPAFPIEGTTIDTSFPSVSSVTDSATGHRWYSVAYETTTASGLHDVGFKIMEGTFTVAGSNFLSALENVALADRRLPITDSDGCRFTIAYGERFSTTDYDLYATTLDLSGGTTIGVSESRAVLATTPLFEDHPAIASSYSGGGPGLRHFVVWDTAAATSDIQGAMYDGHLPSAGFSVLPTGCQGLNLAFSGVPAVGEIINFSLTNAFGASLIVIGTPIPPFTFCGSCQIGVDTLTAFFIPGPAISAYITCDGFLIGLQVAVQGADLGGFSCNNLRVSDTVIVTIL